MEIGNRIKAARTQARLSQRELASKIGVSAGLVGQWESHVKAPGRENLRKIAEITLTSPAQLLGMGESDATVQITSPDEIDMLRRYRRMSVRQRQNLRELMGVAADVRREVKQKAQPAEG